MVLANMIWLSISGAASALALVMIFMDLRLRSALQQVKTENLQLQEALQLAEQEHQQELKNKISEATAKHTSEYTSNDSTEDEPENKDGKYRRLYHKLDEHIQKFSGPANACLKDLAEQLRSTNVSGEIKGNLADLAVFLKRLNPLLNTENIQTTIFGEPKEKTEEEESKENNGHARGLRNVILQQRNIIMDLKKQISGASNEGRDSTLHEKTLTQLESLLTESEKKITSIEKELISTKSQLETKSIQVGRTTFLQNRILDLEAKEKKLTKEVIELKNECLKNGYSTEKENLMSKSIEELKNLVTEREKALDKYKNESASIETEYMRLFNNYQGLLDKYNVKENDDTAFENLPPEQMLELEEIKAMLHTKEYELERTKAECQLLESSYLELIENSDNMQNAKEELDRLRIENITLGDQLEKAMETKHSKDELSKELSEFKEKYTQLKHNLDLNQDELTRLRKKEEELKNLRVEYSMMEEQFLAVASAAMD